MPDAEPVAQRITTGLHKLGLALRHQTWMQAHDAGLSPTQSQILSALSLAGPLSASEVATRVGLTLPTISDAVSALVSKRLVRRAPDPRHPRARLLHLTPSGSRQAGAAKAWPEFLASAVGTLSDGEQRTLLVALMKMIRTLQEQGQIPTARMCVTCRHFRPFVHPDAAPHHCAFVDAPLADRGLRLECADHDEAPVAQRQVAWRQFAEARAATAT